MCFRSDDRRYGFWFPDRDDTRLRREELAGAVRGATPGDLDGARVVVRAQVVERSDGGRIEPYELIATRQELQRSAAPEGVGARRSQQIRQEVKGRSLRIDEPGEPDPGRGAIRPP